jgi:hypothetical protein
MKKIFIILFFIIASCGYQPLYKIEDGKNKLKIREIELTGNKNLSKKISLGLPIEIIKTDETLNKLILQSQKNIIETSKNSKGQVISYKAQISTKLLILDNQDKLLKEKTLIKEFSYNTKENKFKLKEYQIEVENNLINKIVEDINIYLKF